MTIRVLTLICVFLAVSAAAENAFTDQQICRAAIATIMHKDVGIISAVGEGTVSIRYTSDGTKRFKCRIQGDRVMWGSADGRWRDNAYDEKVMWKADGDTLIIRQPWSDGSVSEDNFDRNQLSSD